MLRCVYKFIADESGATAIEYALVASGIFLAIVSILTQVGTALSGVFGKVQVNL